MLTQDDPAPPTSPGPLVLMVDDHVDSLEIYAMFLRAMGFEPLTARTADEAFARACERRPDVVVADVSLAGGSGLDLVRRLRAEARTRDAGIIVLTGHGADAVRREADEAGCDRFFLKPCLPDALTAGIREVMGRQRRPFML